MKQREEGKKKRSVIAQLVLHPSSVWTGCQLDPGNICWLIFRTERRTRSDVGWLRQLFFWAYVCVGFAAELSRCCSWPDVPVIQISVSTTNEVNEGIVRHGGGGAGCGDVGVSQLNQPMRSALRHKQPSWVTQQKCQAAPERSRTSHGSNSPSRMLFPSPVLSASSSQTHKTHAHICHKHSETQMVDAGCCRWHGHAWLCWRGRRWARALVGVKLSLRTFHKIPSWSAHLHQDEADKQTWHKCDVSRKHAYSPPKKPTTDDTTSSRTHEEGGGLLLGQFTLIAFCSYQKKTCSA